MIERAVEPKAMDHHLEEMGGPRGRAIGDWGLRVVSQHRRERMKEGIV